MVNFTIKIYWFYTLIIVYLYVFIRLEFENMSICLLPRESRLVLVVYGRTFNTEGQDTSATVSQTELGWASIQFFNVEGSVFNKLLVPFKYVIVQYILENFLKVNICYHFGLRVLINVWVQLQHPVHTHIVIHIRFLVCTV